MNKKRAGKRIVGGLVALVVLVAFLFAIGVLGIPDAGLEDNSWGEVDDDRIEVITTVWIDNPNPLGFGGDTDVEYDVELQNVRLAEGEGSGLGVPAGRSTQNLTTDLYYNRLPAWWASHLNNDEVSDLRVNATAYTSIGPLSGSPSMTHEDTIDTDIEGALDDGFSELEGTYSGPTGDAVVGGELVEPSVEIENVSVAWGNVTTNETEINVAMDIHNPNAYPIPTPAFTGNVTFNDIPVADWDAGEVELREADDDAVIPGQTTETRTFVIRMDNRNVPPWFATHVERGEQTDGELTAQLALEVGGSQITIPREGDGLVCEFSMTTAIFVDNQETDMQFERCGTTPLEMTQSELDAAGAVLDSSDLEDLLSGDSDGTDGSDTGDDDGDGSDDGGDDDDDGVLP